MRYAKIFGIGCALVGISQYAFGDDENAIPSWQNHEYVVEFSGSGVKKKARDKQFVAETIFTDQSDMPGNVAMTCINEVFTVAVAYKPLDLKDFIVNHRTSRRWRTRKVEMTIEGELQKMNEWTYLPKFGVAIPRKKSDRAKVYNAAIRGQSILLNMDFRESIKLILPKPNTEFAEFGGACGMGNNKNRPHKVTVDDSGVLVDDALEADINGRR